MLNIHEQEGSLPTEQTDYASTELTHLPSEFRYLYEICTSYTTWHLQKRELNMRIKILTLNLESHKMKVVAIVMGT